jgi:hypothetical protein
VARRTLGRVLLPAAWSFLSLPGGVVDGRARPLLLSFDLRRAPRALGWWPQEQKPATPSCPGAPAASELSSRHG